MALKAVKFLHGWRGYNPGEVAGFEPELADGLVTAGVAEAHGEAPATKPEPEPTGDRGAPEGVTKGFLGRRKG